MDSPDDAGGKHKLDNPPEEVARKKSRVCPFDNGSPATHANMSKIAKKLMAKMGHVPGTGLGKVAQGRTEPVQLSTQQGRLGLGHTAPRGLKTDYSKQWDETNEVVSVEEEPQWMHPCTLPPITPQDITSWIYMDEKKMSIGDETDFCSEEVLKEMLSAKNVFDELNDRDLRNARTRANPFETVKSGFFQNRAAMKTANVDAVFDWILSDPKIFGSNPPRSWIPKDHPTDLLYFADVCAGPGGFTEYLLWKRGGSAHGFGFTLKGKDDFRLDNFLAGCAEQFEPHYGVGGYEGDGDVTKPENILEFEKFVHKSTADKGVHVFMADGGFSVEGQENLQEILSKRLYLCQFLTALSVLREGGVLFCKLFDLFTPFSVGLVYLLYRCFHRICIHKPNTSRPANSERYIICEGMLASASVVRDYMRNINDKLDELKKSDSTQDIVSVVPLEKLKEDDTFYDYIIASNEVLAERQTMYLNKYRTFAQNPALLDVGQENVRSKCLEYWSIPDEKRKQAPRPAPSGRLGELCEGDQAKVSFMGQAKPIPFQSCSLFSVKHNVPGLDFHFVPATAELSIIFALGRSFIFEWTQNRWQPLNNPNILVPENTLVCAEQTFKYKGFGNGQMKKSILRIVDAHYLMGEDVSQLPYLERMNRIRKMCLAISHENSRPNLSLVCAADLYPLSQLHRFIESCALGKLKGTKILFYNKPITSEEEKNCEHFSPCRGLYLSRTVSDKWIVCFSKSGQQAYYFNPSTDARVFHDKWADYPDIPLTFQETWKHRMLWDWRNLEIEPEKLGILLEGEADDGDKSEANTLPDVCKLVHANLMANGVPSAKQT